MLFNNDRQKSLKRRFLLILGVITPILGVIAFIAFSCLGLMIIFWDKMLPDLDKKLKILIGVVFIIYAALRFSRLLRKDKNEA